MNKLLDGCRLKLGTCYYPEHWPEKLRMEDIRQMLGSGIEVICILRDCGVPNVKIHGT